MSGDEMVRESGQTILKLIDAFDVIAEAA